MISRITYIALSYIKANKENMRLYDKNKSLIYIT